MKKKCLGFILSAALIMVMAAGCGSGSQETEAPAAKATETEAPAAETVETEATGAAAEEQSEAAASKDTFTVGFDQDFPPMGFVGDDGEYTGFDLELAAEVASRLGKTIVYQPIAWDSKDMELDSGTIDCIWNGFTINGREDNYTWTDAYMENDQVFVVRADSGITGTADLAGKIVDVQADSSAETALNDNQDLIATFGQLIKVADYNTAFMDLESGAVDAIAMDDIVASYQIEKRGVDFVVLEEAIAAEEYGVGFKLGNEELRDQVQAALEEMAADGTLEKISTEWFGKDITTIGK